jgi:hypothetical protein
LRQSRGLSTRSSPRFDLRRRDKRLVTGADALQHGARRPDAGLRLEGRVSKMAIYESPGGQPPAAWVWSEYRGVLPEAAPEPAAPAQTTQAPVAAEIDPIATETIPASARHGLVGVGVAAAVLAIAGLTWLFTTRSASGPAPETPPAATESLPQKSEAAPPPAPEPAAATAPAPTTPPAETAKPATPAPPAGAAHGKKKKHGR